MYSDESAQLCWKKTALTTSSMKSTFTKPADNSTTDFNRSPPTTTENAMQIFKELRDNNQLTDVYLICQDGTRFSAHRPLLAACSNYFKAIFTRPFREKDNNELHFDKMPAAVMKEILDFAYIRKPSISVENVEDLLEWADYLIMEKLVRQCCHFMIENITVIKCLGLMNVARQYQYNDLYLQAFSFTRRHFEQVITTSTEFLQMEPEDLREILSNDQLNVSNEATVWQAVQKWYNFSPDKRSEYIPSLIKTVRLALCTHSLLETVRQDRIIATNEECRQWVGSAFKLAYGFENHVTDEQMYELTNHKVWSPRIPAQVILAVGGWSGGSATTIIESYDQRADEWHTLPFDDLAGSRAYHGCCIFDSQLYLVGGFNGHVYFNSVRSFGLKNKQWKDRAPMNNRRCYLSLAQLDNHIWAIGGYDGQRRLQTAERYCPSDNQWSLITPMSSRRSDGHAVVLNGQVYMIGGFDGNDCLDTIEFYDTQIDRWIPGPVMNHRRSGVGAVVCRDVIYAIGGFNGHARHKSVEKLDLRVGQWQHVREMGITRSNCGVECIDDRIYVMGGFNGHTTIPSVEIYDVRADRWESGPNLALHRSALFCCVLTDGENMEDFVRMPRHFPAHKLKAIHRRLETLERQKVISEEY